MKELISFPHLGDYYVPFSFFIRHTCDAKVMPAPKITKKTIELGSKYSPDFVCVPFKYNLGNYIESLQQGATILLQAGGGCRYGSYMEVQEKILKDLGYKFRMISFLDNGKISIKSIYKAIKKINKISVFKYVYYLIYTIFMITFMDKIDEYIRHNIGFEKKKGSFKKIKKQMLNDFTNSKSIVNLYFLYKKYKYKFKKIDLDKKDVIKVGIIGELYTSMEPFSSYFLEETLASYNIEIKRFTNLTYLLLQKERKINKLLKIAKKYVKNELGADGMDNVARAIYLAKHNYDGIIHIKPFGCTPEIGAMPIIDRVCKDYKIPIIYFSFDNQTSNEGIKTRLEALVDMLKERKNNE